MLIEAEKAKIIQTTKTLDTLIKSKQQRTMKKNMIKQVNETKIKQNSSVQAESTDNFSDKDRYSFNMIQIVLIITLIIDLWRLKRV